MQFKALAAAHGTLLIYPVGMAMFIKTCVLHDMHVHCQAMAVMERVMGIAFTDPDNHLSWWDTFR